VLGLGVIAYKTLQKARIGNQTEKEQPSENMPIPTAKMDSSFAKENAASAEQDSPAEEGTDTFLSSKRTESEQINQANQYIDLVKGGIPGTKEIFELEGMLKHVSDDSPLYGGAIQAHKAATAWATGNYGDARDQINQAVDIFQKSRGGKPYADAALRFANAMPPPGANQDQLQAEISKRSEAMIQKSGMALLTQLGQLTKENGKPNATADRILSSVIGLTEDARNEAELKNIPPERRFDRLYDESPAVASLLLRECENSDCIPDIYPLMLRQKGILASALGGKMAVSPLSLTERGAQDSLILRSAGAERAAGKQTSARTTKAIEEIFRRRLSSGDDSNVQASLHGDDINIMKFLRADEAYIDFYRYTDLLRKPNEASMCAVITGFDARSRLIKLGSAADIDRAVRQWREATIRGNSNWNLTWQTLGARIWTPIERVLSDKVKRVWISPDGPLCWAPWTMIGTDKGWEVSVVASWPQLAYLRHSKQNTTRTLLVVQDVDYGPGQLKSLQALENPSDLGRSSAHKVTVLSGKEATKSAVLRAAGMNSVIHLSTHGFYDLGADGLNSLKGAFVALSGANGGTSGRLNALELAGTDLTKVNLITVAACQSGFGKFMDGQGILGIQMALAAGGARAMLLSLWNTPDNEATRTLLRAFYREHWIRNRGSAEALRIAQNETRQRYPNPRDWAGWVLGGEAW
jgi:hypothetical protein